MRLRKISKVKKFLPIAIVIVIIIVIAIYLSLNPVPVDYRPQYCIENECIPKTVFSQLPPYPEDLAEVKLLIEVGKYDFMENYTTGIPDEYYYKQPEFYPSFTETRNLGLYICPEGGCSGTMVGVMGYGAYPADIIIKSVKPGSSLSAITYFHAAWGIVKYQGMGLSFMYPEYGETKMGQFRVTQDPEKVKDYFKVKISPSYILLEPSYMIFFKDWTQKAKIEIDVSKETPKGKYLIGIISTNPPPELEQGWTRTYRLKYTGVGLIEVGRPQYQIFLEVD